MPGLSNRRQHTIWYLFASAVAVLFVAKLLLRSEPPLYNSGVEPGRLTSQSTIYTSLYGDSVEAELGHLTVPERRGVDTSNVISIAFLRFASTSGDPGPPLFYLQGGPGTPGIPAAQGSLFRLFMTLREFGDVILIDQRGVGQSRPNLECDYGIDLDTDVDEAVDSNLAATLARRFHQCAADLRERGVDLSGYNSDENADDIDDLRLALGYDTVNLLGYSYGTLLAQVYLRRHEEHVGRVVLVGPEAPDQNHKMPANVHEYFVRLDSIGKADPRVSRLMPDLLGTMRTVHQNLRTKPRLITAPLMDAVGDDEGFVRAVFKLFSFFKPDWQLTLGDSYLQIMVANNMHSGDWTRAFPRFYYRLSHGQFRLVANWLRNFRRRPVGNAMTYAVIGSDGCDQIRLDEARRESDTTILSDFGISTVRQPLMLKAWGDLDLGSSFREPIHSKVPVLLIGGTLDAVTPMANVRQLIPRFPNSQLITVHLASHSELIDGKSARGILQFLQGLPVTDTSLTADFSLAPLEDFEYSLEDTLYSLDSTAGIDSALAAYRSLKQQYDTSANFVFDFGETTLNELGYRLLSAGRTADAEAVFKLNVEAFPERFNVYDSFGEALLREGDTLRAVLNYRQSIDLNFLNENAYRMLERLGYSASDDSSM
ncbi:MAG TPA: alpha/beta fold hydrolase [candidate division Zixibacteria bacterium]|nr:alpha/beta fold hydrolase [candidate division Zixibacteria bacterium]